MQLNALVTLYQIVTNMIILNIKRTLDSQSSRLCLAILHHSCFSPTREHPRALARLHVKEALLHVIIQTEAAGFDF